MRPCTALMRWERGDGVGFADDYEVGCRVDDDAGGGGGSDLSVNLEECPEVEERLGCLDCSSASTSYTTTTITEARLKSKYFDDVSCLVPSSLFDWVSLYIGSPDRNTCRVS